MLERRAKPRVKAALRGILFVCCGACVVHGQRNPATGNRTSAPARNNGGASDQAPNAKTVTLRIGEGVNFATGKVTKLQSEVDLALKYLPPQSPHGSRYNVITGQIEYQANVATYQNYPLLEAARTASYKARPDVSRLTVGDINSWTEDEYDIAPGRYVIARGRIDGEHYLVKIHKFAAPSNNPGTWTITFSYEPVKIALGAPKTAGQSIPLSGTLSYRESIHTKKIIDLDLATGNAVERFDGYGVSRSRRGEYAYIDQAGRIIIADADAKPVATLKAPFSEPKTYGRGGPLELAISPDGSLIAVQVERAGTIKSGGRTFQGYAMPTVAVINRDGKEVAAFHRKKGAGWTPDNRLVVAESVEPGLYVSDANLRDLRPIPNAPQIKHMDGAAVDPKGQTVAFAANNRVWLINLDGTNFRQLTDSGLAEITPVWSPDGNFVAIQQIDPNSVVGGVYRIVIVRLSDGKSVVVTDKYGWTREPAGRMSWR